MSQTSQTTDKPLANRLIALYAGGGCLRCSEAAANLRRFSRRLRAKQPKAHTLVRFPRKTWLSCTPRRSAAVFEPAANNGNVSLAEVAVLARFAASAPPDTTLFEIGTFDGRITLNLALNAPPSCRVVTLGLPPQTPTRYDVYESERQYIDKAASGARIDQYRSSYPRLKQSIDQRYGDSASFDFSPWHRTASLVFVDGSHAYEYVHADTATARQLVLPGGA